MPAPWAACTARGRLRARVAAERGFQGEPFKREASVPLTQYSGTRNGLPAGGRRSGPGGGGVIMARPRRHDSVPSLQLGQLLLDNCLLRLDALHTGTLLLNRCGQLRLPVLEDSLAFLALLDLLLQAE